MLDKTYIGNKDINFGLLLADQKPTDFIFGGQTEVKGVDLQPDGQWLNYLPAVGEVQHSVYFDTMACFPYDTEVLMEDLTTKRISEIKKGDYVITHLDNKKKVTNIYSRRYKDIMFEIHIIGLDNPIICTPNHPILTNRGWIVAQELTVNDRVLVPLHDKIIKDNTIKNVETNTNFLWLLGLYLAEGSLGKEATPDNNNPKLKVNGTGNGRGNISFSLHQKETNLVERIRRIGKELFDTNFNVYNKSNSKGIEVRGYNVALRDLLKELGDEYCYNKKLNTRLLTLEPKLQLEIVKGWLAGDGNLNKDDRRIIGVSTSKELIRQIHLIFLRNKIKSSIYTRKAYGNHREVYEIRICGIEINKLYDWEIEPRDSNQEKSRAIDYFENDYLHRKITKIKKVKSYVEKTVYNLEVEDDNSYIVNTVAVHNCVTYSATNANEILIKRQYGIDYNFSDRFIAKMSGTTTQGNYLYKVADSIRKDGWVEEQEYPYPREQREPAFTWNDYYQDIPQILKDIALLNLKDTLIQYEQLGKDFFKEALKQAPLQVTVRAWYDTNGDLIYENSDPTKVNHAVVLVGYKENDYWLIYDSYQNNGNFVKKLEWNYAFGQSAFKYNLTTNFDINNMIFYKEKGDTTGALYYKSPADIYYPINSGVSFNKLFGDFSNHIIKEIDHVHPKGERLGLML